MKSIVSEADAQAAIVDYVRWVRPDWLVFHVPNGGLRSKSEAKRLKRLGVVAGIPDLALIAPGARIYFAEIKTDSAVLSAAQRAMRERLALMGVPFVVIRSIDDMRRALDEWGVRTRQAQAYRVSE